jgi:MFS family permease
VPDFRWLLAVSACSTVAGRALTLVVGYQVYELTQSPLALGVLGLVEAFPALSLALYGGHVADRHNRRSILRVTLAALFACAGVFAVLAALSDGGVLLAGLYGLVFLAGVARGFADPATGALEAQVVPSGLMVKASAWLASSWLSCAVVGPLLGGLTYYGVGAWPTYLVIAAFYAAAWVAVSRITPPPTPQPRQGESVWQSIAEGVKYVARDQVLLGSMALDLFAVLFGGMVALLPVYAKEILHVGPAGLGLLNAAPAAGALVTVLWATRHPPVRHAGRNLLLAVAGFGTCVIVFAFSTDFWLSLAALALSGVCDGLSVVIRRAIVRLLSPEHLRGRIAAVSMIFIGSSNEVGAFESGVAAAALGTVPSVWLGGVVTLLVVAVTAAWAPRLRRLSLEPWRAVEEREKAEGHADEKTLAAPGERGGAVA